MRVNLRQEPTGISVVGINISILNLNLNKYQVSVKTIDGKSFMTFSRLILRNITDNLPVQQIDVRSRDILSNSVILAELLFNELLIETGHFRISIKIGKRIY